MSGVWTGDGWSDGPLPSPGATLDAFSADPFGDAGQIEPTGWVAPDGILAICLGHDAPGFTAFVAPGDYVEMSQTATLEASVGVMIVAARTRAAKLPVPGGGYAWTASVLIDGTVYSSRPIVGKNPTDWGLGNSDDIHRFCVDLSKTNPSTTHEIAFRLTFSGPTLHTEVPYFELEIPAFYVDDIRFLTTTESGTPILCAVQPADGSGLTTSDPIGQLATVQFDVFDVGSDGVDPTSIQATIYDGTSTTGVMVNGAGVNNWVGEVFAVTSEGPTKIRVVLGATSSSTPPLASGRQYTFNLIAETLTTHEFVSLSVTYVVADTVPPAMYAAKAIDLKTVRVTWSEALEADSPAGPHDALNPSLYSLTPVQPDSSTPAVTPNVVGVSIVSDGSPAVIDLLLDIELSPGIDYTLEELGVADLAGNIQTMTIDMPGYVLPVPLGRRFDLYRMLPAMNRQEDTTKDLLKFIRCLQEVVDLLLVDIDNWTTILDPDNAPEPFLDAMLADLGNPFPFDLEETKKRALLRVLVSLYEQKGTAPGIINAIRFFTGIVTTIVPYSGDVMQLGVSKLGVDWTLGPGTLFARFAFKVVSPSALTDDQVTTMRSIAVYMKDARTHLTAIVQPSTAPAYDPVVLGISKLGVDWTLHD